MSNTISKQEIIYKHYIIACEKDKEKVIPFDEWVKEWEEETTPDENAMTCFLEAMDEYAKQEAIDFFKWYGVKMATFIEYITKIKPTVESNEIEEKIIEFEGKSIQELYELYLKSKNQK